MKSKLALPWFVFIGELLPAETDELSIFRFAELLRESQLTEPVMLKCILDFIRELLKTLSSCL